MQLREYMTSDCDQLARLFFQTVHSVNAKDYTKEQLDVWATGNVDLNRWDMSFKEHYSIIATDNGATAICDELESSVTGKKIITHSSITAEPFFEKRGYRVKKE